MDVDQITKLIGSVGLPGFIIVFLMVKGIPTISKFTEQILSLTNEVRTLIHKVEKYLERKQ